MVMISELIRGHTEAIILSLLLKEDSYGYKINQTIEHVTNGALILNEATLYSVFKRLENNHHIQSYWQEGFNHINRKYYSNTEQGLTYLEEHKKS